MIYFCNTKVEGNELFIILRSLLQQRILGHKVHPTFRPTKRFLGQLCFFLTNSSNILHYISLSSFPVFLLHPNSLDGGLLSPAWLELVDSTLFLACINSAQAWFFLQHFFWTCGGKANMINQPDITIEDEWPYRTNSGFSASFRASCMPAAESLRLMFLYLHCSRLR